jgi:hypothetical protein
LSADPDKASAWRQRLEGLPGLRVGLVWATNPDPSLSAELARDCVARSTTLLRLAPLADVPGIGWVSLQKGDAASESRFPPPGLAICDWTDELDDFGDTAALTEALDLVITIDTSVAHLAGALGKPVWLLNRFAGEWRWLLDRNDSPWYPSLRQFRQPAPDDWDSVVRDVREALLQKDPRR